jgi:hypothetical protein
VLPRRACSSRVGLYVELFGSADDGLFRSGLVAAHFLSLRDLRLDHMRIGHVDNGEFRLVAGGVDLDGSYPEDAEQAGLGSGGVLSQQTPGVCETAELTLLRRRPPRVVPLLAVLDVPVLDLHYGGVLGGPAKPTQEYDVPNLCSNCPRLVPRKCQRDACRIALGALPVQRLKACVNALTSW